MWVKVTTLSFQCMDKLNFTTMPENVPIMLALCLMPARPYYAPNYAGIIRPSLVRLSTVRRLYARREPRGCVKNLGVWGARGHGSPRFRRLAQIFIVSIPRIFPGHNQG